MRPLHLHLHGQQRQLAVGTRFVELCAHDVDKRPGVVVVRRLYVPDDGRPVQIVDSVLFVLRV